MRVKKYYKLVRVDYEDSAYMRLKNVSNESGIFKMVKTGSPTAPNLEYSLDGTTWTTYDFTTLPEVAVAAGANIYFRGTNANQKFNRDSSSYVSFSFNKTCEGHGNMCSLFNPDPAVFSTIDSIENYGFYGIFKNCTTLVTAPDFGNNVICIGNSALYSAFQGCTSLTTAPDFSNVTIIVMYGLRYAFQGCTSLTTAPDFSNVTTTYNQSFGAVFQNCTKISNVTAPNIQDLSSSILANWLDGAGTQATGTKTVRVPTGATIATDSTSGIPTGWTRVDY